MIPAAEHARRIKKEHEEQKEYILKLQAGTLHSSQRDLVIERRIKAELVVYDIMYLINMNRRELERLEKTGNIKQAKNLIAETQELLNIRDKRIEDKITIKKRIPGAREFDLYNFYDHAPVVS